MGVGSSRVARSNSRKQQQPPAKPEPVVPVLTTTHPSPPSLPTVVRSRTKYGIGEPEHSPAPPLPPAKAPMIQRSQSTRSPQSAARITERHAQRVRRAYGSEDGQFYQQRSMTVPAAQPLRNPLPPPPKDYISRADFSRVHYSNPRPFVPVPAEDLIRSKTKGKGKADATVGREVFVARGDEPSSSFSSHSSASTSNPPQQVVTTPFGAIYGQQQQQPLTTLQDPGHDKEKAKGGLFSSLFNSRRHSRSTAQPGHDPNTSLTRRPSMQQSTSSAHRSISPPYMLAPRGAQLHVPPPPPFYFYHPEAPGYGFTTFSPHKILYRKQLYPTAEHLYQSMKFMPSKGRGGEPALAERIRTISDHPAQAVLEGRQLNKQARPDWKEMRTKWMDEIMYMKFAQHPNLRHELINTHPAELVFASPQDPFWGLGPDIQGRNELGHSLGRVRARILREMGR